MVKGRALTEKQKRFCDQYLIHLNATQAYIDAGYSTHRRTSASTEGSRLLGNLNIQIYLKKRMDEIQRRTEITQDRVLNEYAKIAFFDPRKLLQEDGRPLKISKLDDESAGAIAGLDVSEDTMGFDITNYKIANKLGALDSIARHLGMFNDSMKHEFGKGGRVEIIIGGDDDEAQH